MCMTYTVSRHAPIAPPEAVDKAFPTVLDTENKTISYSIQDVPSAGWTKEILVRADLRTKSVGAVSIRYIAPDGHKKIRNKVDVSEYFERNKNLSRSLMGEFDFRAAFCVCHLPEDKTEYLECDAGLGGCNGWFHARCVGLSEEDVAELSSERLVCPLCVLYCESKQMTQLLYDKWYDFTCTVFLHCV